MAQILHFADAHIDIATQGRRDPESGLPLRVLDFLAALDQIVDSAINMKVDLVLFAGDTYKDRNPAPTYQREWGKRIVRLSQAAVPTLLLVGNHDMSPAAGRATTLQEFDTLQVPFIKVIDKPCLLKSGDLWDLPLQVIAIPWLFRTSVPTAQAGDGKDEQPPLDVEEWLSKRVGQWMLEVDPAMPTVILAHASVNGASYGNERNVMLGRDMLLPEQMLKQSGVDYVALGHIHKSQDLNAGHHPPIVYPGSIERVDFNEAFDRKHFVIANVLKGKTEVQFCQLQGRPFLDRAIRFAPTDDASQFMRRILDILPGSEEISEAILRLVIDYPRDWDAMLDEAAIRRKVEKAFEFHLIKKKQVESRVRLPGGRGVNELSAYDLLTYYLQSKNIPQQEIDTLRVLAEEILQGSDEQPG